MSYYIATYYAVKMSASPEGELAGLVDDAHAAPAPLAADHIVAEITRGRAGPERVAGCVAAVAGEAGGG